MSWHVALLEGYQFNPYGLPTGLAALAIISCGLIQLLKNRRALISRIFFF